MGSCAWKEAASAPGGFCGSAPSCLLQPAGLWTSGPAAFLPWQAGPWGAPPGVFCSPSLPHSQEPSPGHSTAPRAQMQWPRAVSPGLRLRRAERLTGPSHLCVSLTPSCRPAGSALLSAFAGSLHPACSPRPSCQQGGSPFEVPGPLALLAPPYTTRPRGAASKRVHSEWFFVCVRAFSIASCWITSVFLQMILISNRPC